MKKALWGLPICLTLLIASAFFTACSDDGPADVGGGADAGFDAGYDAGFDAGWDGGASCDGDAGTCPPGYHCENTTSGCAPGCLVDNDCAKYQSCVKSSGKCQDLPTEASITVDTASKTKTITRLVNSSGIEIESNAEGNGSEMLADRGFEWDRPFLNSRGIEPWMIFTTDVSVKAAYEWSTSQVYQGSHSFKVSLTQTGYKQYGGLAQGGLGLAKGREYQFSFMFYDDGGAPGTVYAALMDGQEMIAGPVPIDITFSTGKWTYRSVKLTSSKSTKNGLAGLLLMNEGHLWLDSVSLRPKDSLGGIWQELIQAYIDAGIAGVRLGGTSADGYDWRDGVGPRDQRPVRKSAYSDTLLDPEHVMKFTPYYNDVGTDEFLDFCKAVGAEPMLTVNFPLGQQAAANWVEYANGISPGIQRGIDNLWKIDSYKSTEAAPQGYFAWLRDILAQIPNQHHEPWGVKYWEIGNEQWNEELPEPGSLKGQDNLDNYAANAVGFAAAMKDVDPTILVAANSSPLPIPAPGDYRSKWDTAVLDSAGNSIDFLAPHFYAPGDFNPSSVSPENLYDMIAGIGPYYGIGLANVQSDIATWKTKSGSTRDIRIAVTEYNISNGVFEYKDAYGSNRLRSVIGAASFKNTNMKGQPYIAFQYTLIGMPFGMLDWSPEAKAAGIPLKNGGYLLQKLYQDHFQPLVYSVNVNADEYDTSYDSQPQVSGQVLDVVAAADPAGGKMSLFVVNRKYWPGQILTLIKTGGFGGTHAKAYVLTGAGSDVYNSFEHPDEIYVAEEDIDQIGTEFKYAFKENSVTVIEVTK